MKNKNMSLTPYIEWAERFFGKGNFRIEERNGEVCIDAWNPEAKAIGLITDKISTDNYFNITDG